MLPLFPPYPATEGLSARVAFVLNAALTYVATRMRRIVPGYSGVIIPAGMGNLIDKWVRRRRDAIVALIGRIEAGTLRPYRPRAEKQEAAEPPTRKAGGVRLPAMFGWLCALGPEARGAGDWLVALLEEADMKAMALAHPRLASLFRPVLWMLGKEEPAWLPREVRRPRSERPRPARPAWSRERLRERPSWDAAPEDPWRELERFAEEVRDRQYAENHKQLYAQCPPELVPPCILPGGRRARRASPSSAAPGWAEMAAETIPPGHTVAPGCRLVVEIWEKPTVTVRERNGW